MYERNLPPCLAHDLKAWKKGVRRQFYKTYLAARYEALFDYRQPVRLDIAF